MKLSQVFFIFAIIIGWTFASEKIKPTSSRFFNRKLLNQIKSYIDVEINPCEDFYKYACGKWAEVNANDDYNHTSAISKLDYDINKELSEYLNVMSLRNKPEAVRKAHAFYTSCKNINDFDLLNYISWMEEHENMNWALLASLEEEEIKYDWAHTLGLMRIYGMNNVFLEEFKFENPEKLRTMIYVLNKPEEDGNFANLTYENLENLDTSINMPENIKPLVKLWQEITEFEQRLLELNEVPDKDGPQTVRVDDFPFRWMNKYLRVVLNERALDPYMEVRIENMAYMEALDLLLREYDNEFICRYLEVRFLLHLYDKSNFEDEEGCLGATRGHLTLPINWIYEQQHPELEEEVPKIKQMCENIIEHIKKSFYADKSGLLSKALLEKADKIQVKVGNLPRHNTTKALDAFYESLKLADDDYYGNQLQLWKFYFNVSHSGYGNYLTTTNVTELFFVESYDDAATFLPTYLSTPNVVIVPMFHLKQPFYHWGYDDIYKYGSLGTRVAYSIIRGLFDTLYEEDISAEDLQKIAEVGSIHSTYKALYSLLPDDMKDAEFIKGLRTVFFLNSAQFYCEGGEDEYDFNESYLHISEFSKVFGCQFKNLINSVLRFDNEN